MPGFLIDQGTTMMCTHGAPVTHVPSQVRVRMNQMPVLTMSDVPTIAGCPFIIPTNVPSPCMMLQWVPATRVKIQGQPVLLNLPPAICKAATQVPQGPLNIVAVQARVRGM